MDIWIQNKYANEYNNQIIRHGLRCRYAKGINVKLRESIIMFIKWIRERFDFPIRITVYFKTDDYIIAQDKEKVLGTFFGPFNYYCEPYIKIACGNYDDTNAKTENSETVSIFATIAHELTHYYQWINRYELSSRREEYQATWYSHRIVEEYLEDRGRF